MTIHDIAEVAQQAVLPAMMVLLAIAVYTDWRWRMIYNSLTLPAMVLALLLHLARGGASGLGWSALGLATGLGLMLIPFTFGQMGGGDVKLLAALGAFLGAYAILNVFLYTTLAGGLIALAYAVRGHEGMATLRRTGKLATGFLPLRSNPPSTKSTGPSLTMPYGLAIAAGTLLYLAFGAVV